VKIFVLLKQVPNTTQVKLDPKTGNLIREGVCAIINPEDRHALEAAVQLKESRAAGDAEAAPTTITALSMGPPQAVSALSEALACGADRAVLLTDRLFAGADTWATSSVLARAIEKLGGAELVIAGRQAIDGDTAQIGPQVAEALGLAQATYVTRLRLAGTTLEVTRKVEGAFEELALQLPALITVLAELNTPRRPQLPALLAACEPGAAIKVLDAADLGFRAHEVGLAGSLTEVIQTFSPKGKRETTLLAGNAREMAAQLVARLRQAQVLGTGEVAG
jgi:electron transfer flavoprotein beta subunit